MSEEKSIFEQLRQAREEQQQTIAEMHRLTGVSPNVLQGLEKGDFEVVEPVFMRMGLRTYAEHLGLDENAITQVYDREFNAPPEPTPEAVQPPPSAPSLPFSISPQIRRIGLVAGLVIFVVIVVALLGSDEPEPDVSTGHLRSSAPVARKPLPKGPKVQEKRPFFTDSFLRSLIIAAIASSSVINFRRFLLGIIPPGPSSTSSDASSWTVINFRGLFWGIIFGG